MNTAITGYNDVKESQKIISVTKKDEIMTINTNEKNENNSLTKILDISINSGIFNDSYKYITKNYGSALVSSAGDVLFLSSGTTKRSYSSLQTVGTSPYVHGIPIDLRFAATFVPKLGCTSLVGFGNETEGVFFGSFKESTYPTTGILIRSRGRKDIYKLTITGASAIAGSVDIELDGVVTNVLIGSSDTIYTIASNIASTTLTHDTTDDIDSWETDLLGSAVYFVAVRNGEKTGSFSVTFNTTDATGTLVKTSSTSILDVSETFIPQIEWNVDIGDGTGDLNKLSTNSRISTNYIGSFRIVILDNRVSFYIKNTVSNEYVLVHKYDFTGSFTPFKNKSFIQIVDNGNTTTSVSSSVSNMCMFLMAKLDTKLISNISRIAIGYGQKTSLSSQRNIIAVKNTKAKAGDTSANFFSSRLKSISLGYNSSVFGIVSLIINPVFSSIPTWTGLEIFISSTNSDVVVTGGDVLESYAMNLSSTKEIESDYILGPGQIFALVVYPITGTISADVYGSMTFVEI